MRLIYNGDDVYDENHEIQSIKNTIGTGTLDTDEKTIIPAINELKSNLTQLITTDSFQSTSQTIANGARGVFSVDITKNGYTPIAIAYINLSNGYLDMGSNLLNASDNSASAIVFNRSGSSQSGVYVTIGIVYQKNI